MKAKKEINLLENASFKKLVTFSANTRRKIVVPILVAFLQSIELGDPEVMFIVRTVHTVARCGIQMSWQTPSVVLIFPNTELWLELTGKTVLKPPVLVLYSFKYLESVCFFFLSISVPLQRCSEMKKIFHFNSHCSSLLQFVYFSLFHALGAGNF